MKRRLADLLAAGKRNNNSLPFQPKTSLGQSVDMSAASSTSRFAELISALPAITEVVSGFRLQAGLAVADLEKKNEREEQEERKEQEEREEQEKREERAEQEAREEQEKREEREEGSENDSGPEDEDKEQHVRESEDEVEVGGGSSEDSESRPKQRDVRAHADFENRLLALDSLKLDAKNTRHLAYLEFEMNLDAIDRLRCLAVRNCMVLLNEDHNASFREASGVVAAGLAGKMAGKASYAARVVRHNLQCFLDTGAIPARFQGKHVKIWSLIFDEEFRAALVSFVRPIISDKKRVGQFTADDVVKFVTATYGQDISVFTARRWLHDVGFRRGKHGGAQYFDGYLRADVVKYKEEVFYPTYDQFEGRMAFFDTPKGGGDVDPLVRVEPVALNGRKEIVSVYHDECCFATMDGARQVWQSEEGGALPRAKSDGAKLMVSGLVCVCHGFMTLSPEQAAANPHLPPTSFVTIEPGKNKDGWWRCEDLIKQLGGVMKLFMVLHPDKQALFIFDNSQNHLMTQTNGLCASSLNLDKPKKVAVRVRDGNYFDASGALQVQEMMHTETHAKSLRAILEERDLWAPEMKKEAAVALLAQQADFAAQRGWIRELVEDAGHHVLFLPKFHCQFNPIERFWAYAKYKVRATCDYSLRSLRVKVPATLRCIPLDTARRFFRGVWRFMDASRCRNGVSLTPAQATWITKKFTSHRRIPEGEIAKLLCGRA